MWRVVCAGAGYAFPVVRVRFAEAFTAAGSAAQVSAPRSPPLKLAKGLCVNRLDF